MKNNYHPNLNARSLVQQLRRSLVWFFERAFIKTPSFLLFWEGLQAASENHYAIRLQPEKTKKTFKRHFTNGLRKACGWFYLVCPKSPLVQLVAEEQFPFLILENHLPHYPLVDNDNVQAGYDATEYFIKKGCSHIYASVVPETYVTRTVWRVTSKALQEQSASW